MSGALYGTRVLDLSESVAGQFSARLLGDQGARVQLLEPAGGTLTRRVAGPGTTETPYLFRHLNAGKSILTIDHDDDGAVADLVAGADIVIVGTERHRAVCRSAAPSAIVATITGFGRDGPLSDWRGSDMIYEAFSGAMPSNGAAGREPLYGCGYRASHAAGLAAYCGIVAADIVRQGSGLGQDVDVAIAEVAAAMSIGAVAFGYSGQVPSRRATAQSIINCGGDWVLLWCYPFQWLDFCAALEADDLVDDPRFAEHNTRAKNWAALLAILQKRHAGTPADEIVARLRARRLITAKAQRPSALRDDPHLSARNFWRSADPSRPGGVALGPTFRMSPLPVPASPAAVPQAAPADGKRMPLEGIRILDLTTAWAGPMAGRILGFLGADVLHLEHASKPDLWRHHRQVYNPALYAGSDADGPRHNRNALFNSQNVNKRSLTLDLKAPAGRAVARRIALQCDVVLTNFTSGTIDRLGLGFDALSPERPGIIVCEMPAYGASGPESGALAVGATMEMASGMASLIGYRDGPPTTTGPNYPDPVGGFNAAAAILTALDRRARTGFGGHVEVPQVEAAMQFIGAEILEALETGRDPQRDGNRVKTHAPHNVYPATGEDNWVAISAPGETAWLALSALLERALAADPRFASNAERLLHQDELDAIIADWTRPRDKHEVAALLQAAGVTAAAVLESSELAVHPFFRHRSSFVTLPHEEAGARAYLTVPIRLGATPGGDRSAGPRIGEHTEAVLAEFGVTAEERAALRRDCVTAHEPT